MRIRATLSTLTTRGRAFLTAGVTALLSAVVLGLDDLGRIGALLVLLPVVSAVLVTRGRHRLGLLRTVEPTLVAAGQVARVRLQLSNEGRAPTGLLLLEEQVPYTLGERPRFVVDRMGSGWRRVVTYDVRSDLRGRFTLGPLTVRVNDPFGLVQLDRTFSSSASVVVTPRVHPLPPIPLTGAWTGSGDNRPRDFAGGSAEDVTVREYRRGDDLRRVHWRSSAHAGELMVRREEQPWQSRATVFVDNRQHVHRGSGPTSSLEYAVSVAASAAMHLAQRGFRVRLVTADGGEAGRWHEHGAPASETGPLLESLAVLTATERSRCEATWLNDAHQTGLLVAVLGDLTGDDRAMLDRMRHAARTPLAVALDVRAWVPQHTGNAFVPASAPHPGTAPTGALLTAQGWRCVTAGPRDAVPAVWQELGLVGRRTREVVS